MRSIDNSLTLTMCIGLIQIASGEAEIKTATCEITNTSGVYPIYGTINPVYLTPSQAQGIGVIGPLGLNAKKKTGPFLDSSIRPNMVLIRPWPVATSANNN